MPNVPELQSEAVKWQRRLSMLSSAGLPIAPAQELAKTDLQRIIQGGSPLAEPQIVSMVHSAYTGAVDTPQSSGGADWNPLHVLGNIGKDVTTDVRSFMPGIVHQVADIINPSKWGEAEAGVGKALGDLGAGDIGQAAKDIQATPIVGPLVPGAFALSGGWKNVTEHPLNAFLSVLPIVSAGSKLLTAGADAAEAGTPLAALQQGHPFQAIARATGMEAKLQEGLAKLAPQYQHMPVWRAYNSLARTYARRLQAEVFTKLKAEGLIGKGLSMEQSQRLLIDAQSYNPRFESQPYPVDPKLIASSNGDVHAALQNIPAGADAVAYTIGHDAITETGTTSSTELASRQPIFFSKVAAAASIGEDVAQAAPELIREVRVSPGDVAFENGVWSGDNLVPNRTYVPGEGKQLQAVRDFSTKWQDKSLEMRPDVLKREGKDKASPNVVLDSPITGKPEMFPRSSAVYKTLEKYQSLAQVAERSKNKVEAARVKVLDAQKESSGRTQTYARYGESEADAAKRPPTLPAVSSVYESAQSFLQQGVQGERKTRFEKLDAAFRSGSAQSIRAQINLLRRDLRKGGTSTASQLAYANYLYDSMKGIGAASEKASGGVYRLERAKRSYDFNMKQLEKANTARDAAQAAHYQELVKAPPDRFHPLIKEQARGHLIEDATQTFLKKTEELRSSTQGAGLSEGIAELHHVYQELVSHITSAHSKEELAAFVDAKTLSRVEKTAFQDWVQMAKAGYDPIWTHEIKQYHYDKMTWGEVHPLPLRITTPTSAKARDLIFDFSPQVLDIGAVLSAHAVDYLTAEGSRQFADFLVNKSGIVQNRADIMKDLTARHGVHAETILRDEYVPFDPHAFIPTWKGNANDVFMIPKAVAKGFDMLKDGDKLPFKSIRDPLHRVFKVSVLTGPRHFVHVGLGGLVMTTLQEPGAVLDMLARPKQIMDMIRQGQLPKEVKDLATPAAIRDAYSKGNYEERVDQIHQLRSGTKLGEWYRSHLVVQGLHKAEDRVNRVENVITDFYRGAVGLHELRHGATNEQALAVVNKTLIDVDNMTPFERTVLRQVFPFWTFTKHILRYVMTYPSDHPLRASILSNLANNMEETNASGDPARLSKLFMLGEPDVNGKVNTVDMSNLNPFRSMASVFSMSGFLMGLAPELQFGLKALGINPISGTPSLHQNFSYDAYTGTNVADRPKLNIFDFASTFIPQTQIFDHFLLFSDTMRHLKQTNPEAYSRALYQEMNMPFAIAPINIYDIRAKAAAAQYRDAQQAVTNAMVNGNTDPIRTYEAVPFQGQLYPADQVANYIDNFDKIMPGVAPKAIQRPLKRKKSKLLGGL